MPRLLAQVALTRIRSTVTKAVLPSESLTHLKSSQIDVRTVNGVVQSAIYDDGDKLLSVSQGGSVVRSYAYDGAGRASSVTAGGVTTGLSWDARGYATQVGSQTYVVNGEGARVKESGQNILRSGTDVLAPVLADGSATYTPGVSERRSGATTYLHGGLKSVETQTTPAQTVTASKTYDAFGAELSTTGTWSGPSGYGGGFGYREDGSQFKLLGHRLYDPVAGRFLSRDPIREGRNWYAYCEGDPVNAADPEGLLIVDPIIKKKYPKAGKIIEGHQPQKNKDKRKAMKGRSGATDKDVDGAWQPGKGPRVGRGNDPGAWGYYKHGNVVYIDEKLIKDADNDVPGAREMLRRTLEHEMVHYLDDKDGKEYPGEEGELYEKDVYGSVANSYKELTP